MAQVRHWSAGRWAARVERASLGAPPAAGATPPTRADLVFGLIQQLADACADIEARPRRPVPRLDSDVALPDQLQVLVADLIAAAESSTAGSTTVGSTTAESGPTASVVTAVVILATDAVNATVVAL